MGYISILVLIIFILPPAANKIPDTIALRVFIVNPKGFPDWRFLDALLKHGYELVYKLYCKQLTAISCIGILLLLFI